MVTALLVVVSGVVTELSSRQQAEAAGWVAHTQEVIGRLEATRAALVMAESAERAFLLTGEEGVLAGFASGREAARRDIQGLVRLTADNPQQQQRLQALRSIVQDRFTLLGNIIELRRSGDTEAAVALVRQRGLPQMQQLEAALGALRSAEESLLRERLGTAVQARRLGTLANVAISLLALGLLAYLFHIWSAHERQIAAKADELSRANRRLQESAQLLEQRVAERTSELSEVNAELEAFSRSVAHDLRAPVRNIQAYAAAVLEDQGERLTPEGARFMERLIATSRRMEDLIAGLLEYSRLSRAQMPLERLELQPLVTEVLAHLRRDVEATQAQVTTEAPLPAVIGHRATLVQVLENLVSNALKFVGPGEVPQVRIAAERRGQEVVLAVQDRGIGIAAPDHERVFQAFVRLHGQDTYPGTGIGLAIVRRGIERMGGRVSIDSTPGAGSRFALYLKAA